MSKHVNLEPNGQRSRMWSQSAAATAAEIWQTQFADHYGDDVDIAPPGAWKRTLQQIATATERSFCSVECRYRTFGVSFGANQQRSSKVSARQLADLAARKEAEAARDLTGNFFNDPPPGFSALDGRRR